MKPLSLSFVTLGVWIYATVALASPHSQLRRQEPRDSSSSGILRSKKLRILPVGDSITFGDKSSDGNGYRQDLKSMLEGASNTVEIIGSIRSGNMADNYNEGHSGAVIDQIASFTSAYKQRPNIVLVHAGTNDMNKDLNPTTAPQRVDSLVAKIITACPDATIIVAKIVPSKLKGADARIPLFNTALASLMTTRIQKGQHIVVADIFSAVQVTDLADGIHPNDGGYSKMAVTWANAITSADNSGWVKDPVAPALGCGHNPGWSSLGQIATGAGLGSNIWLSESCTLNQQTGLCDCQKKDVALTPALLASTNKCDIQMVKSPSTTAVRFGDLNGDGKSDFLYVDSVGAVRAFLNVGEGTKVSWLDQGIIATGVGATRGTVQFADINGDGRVDYLWVHDDGSVDCWLNRGGPDNGPNAGKIAWHPQERIASGIGKDGAGVRFADLNGDGRAEYLYVNTDSSVEAYLNMGPGGGGADSGVVGWSSQGVVATGVGVTRENVVFADMNGDGKADYLAVSRTDGSVRMWLNGGSADNGARVNWASHGTIATGVGTTGQGLQFGDLNGDLRAEYLDVAYDTSATNAWLNGC